MSVGEKQSSLILFHPWPVFFPSERSSATLHFVWPPPTLGDSFRDSHRNHRAACRCDGADHACCGTRIARHHPLAHFLALPQRSRAGRHRILRRLLRRVPRQSGRRQVAGFRLLAIAALRLRMERTARLARGWIARVRRVRCGTRSFRHDRQCLYRLTGVGWQHPLPLPSLPNAKGVRRQTRDWHRTRVGLAVFRHPSCIRFARHRRTQLPANRPRTQLDLHRQRLRFVVRRSTLVADGGDVSLTAGIFQARAAAWW